MNIHNCYSKRICCKKEKLKMKFLVFALLVVLSITMAHGGLLAGHGAVLTAPAVAVAHPAVLGHGTIIGHGHGTVGLGHGAIW